MNSNKNSSGGRHQGKKGPQKSSTNKTVGNKRHSDSSKSKLFKKSSESEEKRGPKKIRKKEI